MASKKKLQSILIVIDYFGEWPPWFDFFLESCKRNPTIDWLFHTDCPVKYYHIDNVKFKHISFNDYIDKVNKKLNVNFNPPGSYKLCDLKPMCGDLHEEDIKGYDFYGYGDIDVIYGNIRHFYTDKVLKNNHVISTHAWCIAGHLSLFRNVKWIREAYKRCPNWKSFVENPESCRFDEDIFSNVFRYPRINDKCKIWYDLLHPFSIKYRRKVYLKEQYTTPLTPSPWRNGEDIHPQVWYWKDGTVTNEIDGNQEFIYLHFMNFFSARWMDSKYKIQPCWKDLNEIVYITLAEVRSKGMVINRSGFHPLI